jgi:hypothetical protein
VPPPGVAGTGKCPGQFASPFHSYLTREDLSFEGSKLRVLEQAEGSALGQELGQPAGKALGVPIRLGQFGEFPSGLVDLAYSELGALFGRALPLTPMRALPCRLPVPNAAALTLLGLLRHSPTWPAALAAAPSVSLHGHGRDHWRLGGRRQHLPL